MKLMRWIRKKLRKRAEKKQEALDQAYWSSLKGKYTGKSGWVIGNGPSLKYADLDRLKGEISIASNKIYLAFEETEWRPDFVTAVDRVLWPKIYEKALDAYPRIHLPKYLLSDEFPRPEQLISWNPLKMPRSKPDNSCCMCSDDAVKGFHGGSTVTYENLQLAMHLGLNPIYLIGCDHYYRGESSVAQSQEVEAITINHFHPEYRSKGESVSPASIDLMTNSYEHARFFAEKNGYQIYDATRGGHLEVFERKDFDAIFDTSCAQNSTN